jgi:aminopeptidase N
VDPNDPMVEEKEAEIFLYVAHEIAHQWTGNLVTTKWWDTIWLNEGLTEFFTYFSGETVKDPCDLFSTSSFFHFS